MIRWILIGDFFFFLNKKVKSTSKWATKNMTKVKNYNHQQYPSCVPHWLDEPPPETSWLMWASSGCERHALYSWSVRVASCWSQRPEMEMRNKICILYKYILFVTISRRVFTLVLNINVKRRRKKKYRSYMKILIKNSWKN